MEGQQQQFNTTAAFSSSTAPMFSNMTVLSSMMTASGSGEFWASSHLVSSWPTPAYTPPAPAEALVYSPTPPTPRPPEMVITSPLWEDPIDRLLRRHRKVRPIKNEGE